MAAQLHERDIGAIGPRDRTIFPSRKPWRSASRWVRSVGCKDTAVGGDRTLPGADGNREDRIALGAGYAARWPEYEHGWAGSAAAFVFHS